jgi:hypothetical protein
MRNILLSGGFMRKIIILALAVFLLFGCAGQKFYNSKGIYYPAKPAQELTALHKFNTPNAPDSKLNGHTYGAVLSAGDRLYCPVLTYYKQGNERYNYTTVYAVNKGDFSLADSLVLSKAGGNWKFTHLVWGDSLLVIGLADSVCQIITTDQNLNLGKIYPTGIRAIAISYAGMSGDKLRLVVTDAKSQVYMYDFHTKGMVLERKRLLLKGKGYISSDLDGKRLWLFEPDKTALRTAQYDLSAIDPVPVYKDINYPESDTLAMYYNPQAVDSTLCIQYFKTVPNPKKPEGYDFIAKAYVYNCHSGKLINTIDQHIVGYDMLQQDGKTYLFTAVSKSRMQYNISEVTPGLKTEKDLVSFSPDGYDNNAFSSMNTTYNLLSDGDNLYATGDYYQKAGLATDPNIQTVAKAGKWAFQPQLFLAVYPLK